MLPNLIIIGAMKSGTTSLHRYLNMHPDISMTERKELDFFIEHNNWSKGIRWYESNFTGNAQIQGESSPNYTKYPQNSGVPKRMHSIVPDAKLIYILRDPVERIVSQYIHLYSWNREDKPFAEAVMVNAKSYSYIECSKYHMQLEQFLAYYPKSSILILDMMELQNNRQGTLKQVFQFLGVDDSFYCDEYSKVFHESSKRRKNRLGKFLSRLPKGRGVNGLLPPQWTSTEVKRPVLDAQSKQYLIEQLQDDVTQLRRLTGQKFESWCL